MLALFVSAGTIKRGAETKKFASLLLIVPMLCVGTQEVNAQRPGQPFIHRAWE